MDAVKKAISNIQKEYGKGSIGTLDSAAIDIKRFSSGSFTIDNAIGGGYPYGRIIEVFSSDESTGKTTLAIHACIEIQRKGELAAYIDMEHAFDPKYAADLGLNTSKIYFSQPDYGEQAIEILRQLVKSQAFSLIVVDSVTALVPKAELDGEAGESKMGLHARLMSQAMRQLTAETAKYNCTVLFINQMRSKIGVMYGDPAVTTGGNALKFYASIRMRLYKSKADKDKEGVAISNKVRAKIVKNKTAPPFKEATFTILYGKGIDNVQEVIDLGVDMDIIKKNGSWYSYDDTKLGQGSESVKSILLDNPELFDTIVAQIKEQL